MATKNVPKAKAPERKPQRSFAEIAQEAKDRPEILPKIPFGEKGWEGSREIEFLEAEPRVFTYESTFDNDPGEASSINVRWLDPDTPGVKPGEPHQLVIPGNPKHGLTAGVAKLYKAHGGNLKGVKARITVRNYTHEKYGKTRGFSVIDLSEPDDTPEE